MTQPPVYRMGWPEVYERLAALDLPTGGIFGIPRGGAIVAGLTGRAVMDRRDAVAIVDDIVDSGKTRSRWADGRLCFYALVDKTTEVGMRGQWVVFPWEEPDPSADVEDCVVRLLQHLGEHAGREGLQGTPARVAKALREMTAGRSEDPAALLAKRFLPACDEMVILRGVPFWSLCEHHMLPFHGEATVGYLPGPKGVVGLSKLARLVQCFARRLQIQERMTKEIGEALETHGEARGVAVMVTAAHTCMAMRGIRSDGRLVTTYLSGPFKTDAAARAEFMATARGEGAR